jgi:hypothetical protein
MFGIPVYTDRIILEPWFCMDTFKLIWNDTVDWGGVRETLDLISDGERAIIREHNQAVFDEFLGPERVAKYFIDTALEANSRNS